MNLLSRLLGKRPDERDALRPAWNRVIAIARQTRWYAQLGVEDSMPGRFDMITLVSALAMLRMEREPALAEGPARLTELFVTDMDGQLRQTGIGDPTVGKHVRKLVTTLGGRLGALREALPLGAEAVTQVLARNVTVREGTDLAPLAQGVLALWQQIDATPADALMAGRFGDEAQ